MVLQRTLGDSRESEAGGIGGFLYRHDGRALA